MKNLRVLILVLLALVLLARPAPVRADVAPPQNPPGANPEPGAGTQVRMESERVIVEVLAQTPSGSLGRAHVTANFWMRNLGAATETLYVRYPAGAQDGHGGTRMVENLSIKVDGLAATLSQTYGPDPRWDSSEAPWVEFPVVFPPDTVVQIKVSYDLEATGYSPQVQFDYVLSTGAGWNGTIGRAEIILRLPYAFDPMNYYDLPSPQNLVIAGREATWVFNDLEPEPADNLVFNLVPPQDWQAVLRAQQDAAANPNDGEAWGRLGKAYKQIFLFSKGFRDDPVGDDLYRRALEAYETCLRLKPDDAQWHAGFAQLLGEHSYWSSWSDPAAAQSERLRALQEMHTALSLAPDDPVVLRLAGELVWVMDGGLVQQADDSFVFVWLTATPEIVAPATLPPSPVPATAQAVTVLPYATAASVPEPSPAVPLCGSLLLPLLAGLALALRRKAG